MDASALRGELQSLREAKEAGEAASAAAIASLEARLAEVQRARDDLAASNAAASERAIVARVDAGERARRARTDEREARGRVGRALRRAASKWEADKQSLERAKDALAVVLAQIEDTEGRTL